VQAGCFSGFSVHNRQAAAEIAQAHDGQFARKQGQAHEQTFLTPRIEAQGIKIPPKSAVFAAQQFQLADFPASAFS